ncbi:MAG: hypothetical protein ACE5R6_14655 [Candidatus Heimdallarchaeota archaeon]
MQKRIQRLIDRLDSLLKKGKIDQRTYDQMREAFETKLRELKESPRNEKGWNEKKEQYIATTPSHSYIVSELEDINVELDGNRPPRSLISYLQAKIAYRDLLDKKKTLIEQEAEIREKYQKNQISKKDFLRETSTLSERVAKLSESIETKRATLLESRGRTFKLNEELDFLKKKMDALEKALALEKIDNEAYLTMKQDITSKKIKIRQEIQSDVKRFSRWVAFFEQELQHRQTQLKQIQSDEPFEVTERKQQKINELLKFIELLHTDISMFSSEITRIPVVEDGRESDEKISQKIPTERPIEEEKKIGIQVEDTKTAWQCVGNMVQSTARDLIGICSRPLVRENQLYLEIVKINEIQDNIIEEIYNLIKHSLAISGITNLTKRRAIIADYISKTTGVEKTKALSPTVVGEFYRSMRISIPEGLDQGEIKPIGCVPFSAIQELNKKCIIIKEKSIEPPIPEGQLAFVEEKFSPSECIGSIIRDSMGRVRGQIIEMLSHPIFGQIMLIISKGPRPELLEWILSQTNQVKSKVLTQEEKTWLTQFLVAKRLEIVEPESLNPDNLISYCLVEGIPLLPNEIRISYLSWISAGFLRRRGTEFTIRGSDTTLKPFPEGLYEVEYKPIITGNANKLGYAIGFDHTKGEVKIVYASHFSENLIPLIYGSVVDKENIKNVFTKMKQEICEKLNIPIKKGLMPSSVLRYLIKEKLKSIKKLTAIRPKFKKMKDHLKMNTLALKDVEIKENEIILKETGNNQILNEI